MARIIYAEDDELVAGLVCNYLNDAGHAVGVVGDGLAAFKIIMAKKPDLVILDCSMPGMGGI